MTNFEQDLLADGDAASALAHLRAARTTADARWQAPSARIERAAVIGAGAMGTGIAMALADAGISVRLLDADPLRLDQARAQVAADYGRASARGRIAAHEAEARLARIGATKSIAEIGPVDVAIEAVFEDMELKRRIMAELDAVLPAGVVLATNTSTLDIDLIAKATRRPKDVVGAHFFIPAQVTGLVEIVRGQATSEATLDRIGALAKKMGKAGVVARVCDGFIGNRMFDQFWRQAMFLAETGPSPGRIDAVLEKWGFAIGPFRTLDMIGNELPWGTIRKRAKEKPVGRQPRSYDLICEAGRSGQKAGKGWYRYVQGERRPIDDPEAGSLIEQAAAQSGATRRDVSDAEIIGRCVFALANEGARLLGEGIAEREGDIDLMSVMAYGFPSARGGPLFFVRQFGCARMVAQFQNYAKAHGDPDFWRPAPLFMRELDWRDNKHSFD